MYSILYFGATDAGTTSRHRADALTRLGHRVAIFDPANVVKTIFFKDLCARINYHSGYRLIQFFMKKWLREIILKHQDIDLIWVDGGEYFGRGALALIKLLGVPVVLFNHDDPTGVRDYRRFYSLRHALPLYDLVTAVRNESFDELKSLCSGIVLKIWRTYDEVAHSSALISEVPEFYKSDVCFVGTWIRNENRDIFLLNLIDQGIEVAIWGSRWNLSPNWNRLKFFWRGDALAGENYVYAIRGSKVCLGLLSKGNRDLHTTRSMEIPYAGGVLCAQRTVEHSELYKEDIEAIFWSDSTECVEKCRKLINDSVFREAVRSAGHKRVIQNKVGNEDVCASILRALNL